MIRATYFLPGVLCLCSAVPVLAQSTGGDIVRRQKQDKISNSERLQLVREKLNRLQQVPKQKILDTLDFEQKNDLAIRKTLDGIIGPVRLQVIEDTGQLLISSPNARDVEQVQELANIIVNSLVSNRVNIETFKLENANAQFIAATSQEIYNENFRSLHGIVTIVALDIRNVKIIGPAPAVTVAKRLVKSFDE